MFWCEIWDKSHSWWHVDDKFHSASPREILLSSKLHHSCDLSQITPQNMLLPIQITVLFWLTNSSLCLFRAVFSLPGHSLPLLYTDLCLLQPWSRAFFFVLRALRKCSCHDRDSPSMLDPPPMSEFLELHACSVRIKGRHALKWGTCSNSNTEQQYSIQWQLRQTTSVSLKLAVRGDWSKWLGSASTLYSILR